MPARRSPLPCAGGQPLRSPRETTQPKLSDAPYWATGQTAIYLVRNGNGCDPAPRGRARPGSRSDDDHHGDGDAAGVRNAQRSSGHIAREVASHKRKGPTSQKTSGLRYCRQRPTLPRSYPRSTIGGSRLNFRVRNGNGCDPAPMTTGIGGPEAARVRSARQPVSVLPGVPPSPACANFGGSSQAMSKSQS